MDNTETTTTTTKHTKKLWIGGIAAGATLVLASVGITLAVTEGFDDFGDDDATSQDVREGATTNDTDDVATNATDADDVAISEADRSKAEKAALATPEAKGGTVADVERSNDADHAYEVDVTLEDGTDVDVELDESFSVTRVDTN